MRGLGKIPSELKELCAANAWIDCMFMAVTRPGVPAAEVLRIGIEAYRANCFLQSGGRLFVSYRIVRR